MLCKQPFVRGEVVFGCGQCLPCRINRRRLWADRILIESQIHGDSIFATLTYSPEFVPDNGSLVPRHLRLFLARLRKLLGPRSFRFYACGEYGDETQRPHYHVVFFGLSVLHGLCIQEKWGMGITEVSPLTPERAGYVAGYVTKKWTDARHPALQGRHPEFARMSNRPGIGATALDAVVEALHTDVGLDALINTGDVPVRLRSGRRNIRLGRYLRKKLLEAIGAPDKWNEVAKIKASFENQAEMRALLQGYRAVTQNPFGSLKDALISANQARILQVEARSKLRRRKI